jgi:hypothetical protein
MIFIVTLHESLPNRDSSEDGSGKIGHLFSSVRNNRFDGIQKDSRLMMVTRSRRFTGSGELVQHGQR